MTMDHIGDDRLLAHLDDELPESERVAVERHLRSCDDCRGRFDSLRASAAALGRALEHLDRPGPSVEWSEIVARRRGRTSRERLLPTHLKVAALLFAVVGAAAATVPGSPVRAWLSQVLTEVTSPDRQEVTPPEPAGPSEEADAASVAVAPVDGRVEVHLLRPDPGTSVGVRLVDGDQASVASARARFRTGPGRIEVYPTGSGDVRIALPRSARSVRVLVDGRVVVTRGDGGLELIRPALDSLGIDLRFRIDG